MSHLNLCKDHKQEWKQSEYAKENCNYCNALARIDELTVENERLKKITMLIAPEVRQINKTVIAITL